METTENKLRRLFFFFFSRSVTTSRPRKEEKILLEKGKYDLTNQTKLSWSICSPFAYDDDSRPLKICFPPPRVATHNATRTRTEGETQTAKNVSFICTRQLPKSCECWIRTDVRRIPSITINKLEEEKKSEGLFLTCYYYCYDGSDKTHEEKEFARSHSELRE